MIRKLALAAVLVGGIVAIDIHTKSWATYALDHGLTIRCPLTGPCGRSAPADAAAAGMEHGAAAVSSMVGIPLTLAYNQGVAFGLPLPSAGRWIIIVATILVLGVLSRMFMMAGSGEWSKLLAIQLVGAGAIGNLIDRVRWDRGVVDFIGPFDIGTIQAPIFNIADMAITMGAFLLALALLREDAAANAQQEAVLEMDGTVS